MKDADCKPRLTINRCPVHQEFWSVSIDSGSSGTRITPSKCCGQWREVISWKLSERDWEEIVLQAEQAAEEASYE